LYTLREQPKKLNTRCVESLICSAISHS
jgi:hypothetical protein